MKLIKNIMLLFLVLASGTIFAQDELPGGEVDVVKSFNARLVETEKVNITPQLPSLDTTSKRQFYDVITKTIQVQYLPPKIKPLAAKRKSLQKKYDGYAKLGVGLPTALFADASYDYIDKKKKHRFGVSVFHHSSNNTKKVENQRFAYTKGEVNGIYYSKQGFALRGLLGFSADKVHFYGYNDLNAELDTTLYSFEAENVKQRFSTFYGNLEIFNGEKLALDFNYSAAVDFYAMQDLYAANENGFALTLAATKWFNEKHPLNVKIITDFTAFDNGEKESLNNFALQPNFTFHADRFKVKIGVNVTAHDDEFRVFPDVEANVNIIDGVVTAFIGTDGGLHKNSFKNLSDYNPFIASKLDFRNSVTTHYYGGAKGNAAGIEYNVSGGYKKVDDLAMFLLSSPEDSIARFNVLYDTASIVNIKATLLAPLTKELSLTASFNQNIYSLENEEKAWHLPALTVSAGARYRTADQKLLVKADFFLENGVSYKTTTGEAETLNGLFDVSVGAEYFFTKNVGGFVQLNNLAANKRQRWHRYPTLGLNVLLGVTAKF